MNSFPLGLDMRLLVSVQIVLRIAGFEDQLATSGAIAKSIGAHPAYVRQLSALMGDAGLVRGIKGQGFQLARAPAAISILDIYDAVRPEEDGRRRAYEDHAPGPLLDVLSSELGRAERAYRKVLQASNIADIAEDLGLLTA